MFTDKLSKLLLTIIKVYQNFISPLLPARCRYYPTCSEYGKTAIEWHGSIKGGLLTLKRVLSCHPFGGSGIDFVPLPLYKDTFYPLARYRPSIPLAKNVLDKTNLTTVSSAQPNYIADGIRVVERGVYKDFSSYSARLNSKL